MDSSLHFARLSNILFLQGTLLDELEAEIGFIAWWCMHQRSWESTFFSATLNYMESGIQISGQKSMRTRSCLTGLFGDTVRRSPEPRGTNFLLLIATLVSVRDYLPPLAQSGMASNLIIQMCFAFSTPLHYDSFSPSLPFRRGAVTACLHGLHAVTLYKWRLLIYYSTLWVTLFEFLEHARARLVWNGSSGILADLRRYTYHISHQQHFLLY